MAKKNFSRVETVANTPKLPRKLAVVPKTATEEVVNLERINLVDRENWLRALDICKAKKDQPLHTLLQEIETYQGQIDQALQTAQAQSTIYAFAIGTRLDVIEEQELFKEKGYDNLTAFIKNGEVRRPGGNSITTRQVWAYRRVTRGLIEFLSIAEAIRHGELISDELKEHLANLGSRVNQDVVETFLNSYTESITGVLELGVSKLEQVYRLPGPMALTGLLAGKLPLEEHIVEVHDISFSQLRKAISLHEQYRKSPTKKDKITKADRSLNDLEKIIESLVNIKLNKTQRSRLNELKQLLEKL
jgi:hypothetical protein